MEIVGRLTADATVNTLKDERQVVHFTLAVNDRYRPKNGEPVTVTSFFNCSYWLNVKRARFLKKGTLIAVSGRIYVRAYTAPDGTAKGSLQCHVNNFQIHAWPKEVTLIGKAKANAEDESKEDLPF